MNNHYIQSLRPLFYDAFDTPRIDTFRGTGTVALRPRIKILQRQGKIYKLCRKADTATPQKKEEMCVVMARDFGRTEASSRNLKCNTARSSPSSATNVIVACILN